MTGWQLAALALVLVLGCFLAWQFWLIWTLHQENNQLRAQVCAYQQLVERQLDQVPRPCP